MTTHSSRRVKLAGSRSGAVMPFFAILLTLIIILIGFAVNLAHMQLVTTQLKIATDAASHAGGRALSIHQSTDLAIAQVEKTIRANQVDGKYLSVLEGSENVNVVFGKSIRDNGGKGAYRFSPLDKSIVDSGQERASSLGVVGKVNISMIFGGSAASSFSPIRRSIATQVDRDIALVLDRSGSMLYFRDQVQLHAMFDLLYQTTETIEVSGYTKYHYWELQKRGKSKKGSWKDKGYHRSEEADSTWQVRDLLDTHTVPASSYERRLISSTELNNAKASLYSQKFSGNLIYQLERSWNSEHSLGESYSSSEGDKLTCAMAQYCHDWQNSPDAPRNSRWDYLSQGVKAFIDVLKETDQEEHLSLVTFSNSPTLDYLLTSNYAPVLEKVLTIRPNGGTGIGDGMLRSVEPIVSGENARLFAVKTIVVLTDGENNSGVRPLEAARTILESNDVTIHTVTFTPGADQEAMQEVAGAGKGRHYHADDGSELVNIFAEIANNLPTILTE